VAIDLPGHGKSAGRGFRGVADYAYFVVELAAALGWDRLVPASPPPGGAPPPAHASQPPAAAGRAHPRRHGRPPARRPRPAARSARGPRERTRRDGRSLVGGLERGAA